MSQSVFDVVMLWSDLQTHWHVVPDTTMAQALLYESSIRYLGELCQSTFHDNKVMSILLSSVPLEYDLKWLTLWRERFPIECPLRFEPTE